MATVAAPSTPPAPPTPVEGEVAIVKPPKKKKLTKAERKAKKLAEKIAFQKLEIREHLKRELALSKKSVRRGRPQWLEVCKEIRIRELFAEVQCWHEKVDRLFEAKDDQIKYMLSDLDTTEDMMNRNNEAAMKQMNYLQKVLSLLEEASKRLYSSRATEAIEEFYLEMKEYERMKASFKEHCENVMHATNMCVECDIENDFKIYLMRRDDVANTQIEARYAYRNKIVDLMTKLHQQLLNFIESLQCANIDPEKYERIGLLTKQQRFLQEEMQKLDKSEVQLTHQLNDLQNRLYKMEAETEKEMSDLHLELWHFSEAHNNIERSMEKVRADTFEKLRVLSNITYEVGKFFEKIVKKGELMLSLAADCRKFQTEAEKVVPWGNFEQPEYDLDNLSDSNSINERFPLDVQNIKQNINICETELCIQMSLMVKLWHRKAIVETQNAFLQRELNELSEQNEKYRNIVRQLSEYTGNGDLSEVIKVVCVLPEKVDDRPQPNSPNRHQHRHHRHSTDSHITMPNLLEPTSIDLNPLERRPFDVINYPVDINHMPL